ncbi:acyltransferase family protein [Thomasclavelia cocleata]|uniref:acyltransferase family protein n=1 Tax=Thomasclavelia cocleata TaxID=69824 RepID=UPI00248B8660|nr:acyltransferase [Thomasclavelia cocleata]
MKYVFFSIGLMCLLILLLGNLVLIINRKKEKLFYTNFLCKYSMTAIKGMAILIIIMGHLGNIFGVRVFNPLGSCGVAIFLFCSGYGLQKSYYKKNLKNYWKKRFFAAYIPYICIEIISYIFLVKEISALEIIKDIILIDTVHPFGWYMQCLFIWYISFYFSSLLEQRKQGLKYWGLFMTSLFLFIFMRSLFKQQAVSFVLGVWMASDNSKYKTDSINIGIILGILGVALLGIKQIAIIRNSSWIIFYAVEMFQCTLLGMSIILIVDNLVKNKREIISKSLYCIGIISYEIYLIHAFLLPQYPSYHGIFIFYVLTLLCSLFMYVTNKLIKRSCRYEKVKSI